jgi:hypothetical protein
MDILSRIDLLSKKVWNLYGVSKKCERINRKSNIRAESGLVSGGRRGLNRQNPGGMTFGVTMVFEEFVLNLI